VDDKVNKVLIFTMEIYSMGASYVKDSFLREQSDCSLDSGCLFGARFILASALMITCLMIVPGSARSESITIGGTGAGVGTMRILAQEFQKTYPGDTIKVLDSIGSGGGIRAVLKGEREEKEPKHPKLHLRCNTAGPGFRQKTGRKRVHACRSCIGLYQNAEKMG
jgi:hypothetical protein